MSNIIETIRSLPEMEGYKPASQQIITDAELQLRLRFASDYKTYLSEFGEVSARGMELTGIIEADYINVVTVTKEKWAMCPQVSHNLYVVEDTHIDGIIIWQDENGAIYQSFPNNQPKQIANSLVEFIENRSKKQ